MRMTVPPNPWTAAAAAVLAWCFTHSANAAPELMPVAGAEGTGWKRALPGWRYEFPRDHFTHPDFRTEWWYVTGRVRTASGHRFGYQFTIFRRGLRPPQESPAVKSRWVINDLPLGHLALTDVDGGRFYYHQKLVRGAFGEAGFASGPEAGGEENGKDANGGLGSALAWMGDWSLRLVDTKGAMALKAGQDGSMLDLRLEPSSDRPPVINGKDGVSQKSAGPGNASHYYSWPKLNTTGTITMAGKSETVSGLSWLDREWATNQLSSGQTGWDWLSLHLSDGSDLMLYQLRGAEGTADAFSSGTLIDRDGAVSPLTSRDFTLTPVPGQTWRSPKTGGNYPAAWQVEIPARRLSLTVRAPFSSQELALEPVSYWEGAADASGRRADLALTGEGYLEMTGYAGELKVLKE